MACCEVTCLIVLLVLLIVYIKRRGDKSTQAKLLERIEKLKVLFSSTEDAAIQPYTVNISQEDVTDLKSRLAKRHVMQDLTPECEEDMPYGMSAEYINTLAEHWIQYDCSTVERVMGQFNHFTTKIGGTDLHFIHQAGPQGSVPVLLLHGWPSTVWEFHKTIPLLEQQGYSVVCPSIPGMGFSGKPSTTGTSPAVMACMYHQAMVRLGYTTYVIHGGDWGALIGKLMTIMFPSAIRGLHLTMNIPGMSASHVAESLVGMVAPGLVYTTLQEIKQVHPISEVFKRWYDGFAYFHIQSTMPDCIGAGMIDSPTGLVGWIGMMYALASADRNNKAKKKRSIYQEGLHAFGMDNACAMLTIYWTTKTIQSSMRIYAEFWRNDRELMGQSVPASVPVGICNFPNEIAHYTEFSSKPCYGGLKRFKYFSSGGHFCNLDSTEEVVQDLIEFVSDL